jgi:hypothetical protein
VIEPATGPGRWSWSDTKGLHEGIGWRNDAFASIDPPRRGVPPTLRRPCWSLVRRVLEKAGLVFLYLTADRGPVCASKRGQSGLGVQLAWVHADRESNSRSRRPSSPLSEWTNSSIRAAPP